MKSRVTQVAVLSIFVIGAFGFGWTSKAYSEPVASQKKQRNFGAEAQFVGQQKSKIIRIREGSTPEEITRRIMKDAPNLRENPEYFIPARVFATYTTRDGNPISADVFFSWSIDTPQGVININGSTQTNEHGFFAVLIPDGPEVQFTIREKK